MGGKRGVAQLTMKLLLAALAKNHREQYAAKNNGCRRSVTAGWNPVIRFRLAAVRTLFCKPVHVAR